MNDISHAINGPRAAASGAVSQPRKPQTDRPRRAKTAALADLDRLVHAAEGRYTFGTSPFALTLAWIDWAVHLANAPFFRLELAVEAASAWLAVGSGRWSEDMVATVAADRRFNDLRWKSYPFSIPVHAHLLAEAWVGKAADLPGVKSENQRLIGFAARQWLDAISPVNFPWSNPEILDSIGRTRGLNLVSGARNLAIDWAQLWCRHEASREAIKVGRDIAATRGSVIFRNRLVELIQYSADTDQVRPEPILIVPAWIMKYYILDLSAQNSLVGYLVRAGYTVFCISWRNPTVDMRDVSFDDYRREGVLAALAAVSTICPSVKIHACGYCLGGSLLAIAAAAMARDGDDRLGDVTLFCAQTDFTESGELQLFITEDQIAFLDDVMSVQGTLEGKQMGSAFGLLRSRDLIWSRLMRTYWLGEREHPNDLMTWNADVTRMPARMQTEYLRGLFLNNDLAEGRYAVEGRPISINDIHVPIFAVATETDHVAPWRSVHKLHLLNDGDLTFVLTSGGHNAGIVSEPGHPRRRFRIRRRRHGDLYAGPEEWLGKAEQREGSWWPAWRDWLDAHSGPRDHGPPLMGAPGAGYPVLAAAPGSYVFES